MHRPLFYGICKDGFIKEKTRQIYQKYGFKEIKLDNYEYVRGDIAFERWL